MQTLKQSSEIGLAEGLLSKPLSRGPYLIYTDDVLMHALRDGMHRFSTRLDRLSSLIYKSYWDETIFYTMDEPEASRWRVNQDGFTRLSQTKHSKKIFTNLAEVGPYTSLYTSQSHEVGLIHWPEDHDEVEAPAPIEPLALPPIESGNFQYTTALQLGSRAIVATDQGFFAYDPEQKTFARIEAIKGDLGNTWNDFIYCPSANGKGAVIYLKSRQSESGYRLGILRYEKGRGYTWTKLKLKGLSELGEVHALLHEKKDGREWLWLGGSENTFRYDLNDSRSFPRLDTNLTSVRESSTATTYYGGFGPIADKIRMPFPQKSLRIGFAAPPAALEAKAYQTRLLGFTDAWSDPDTLNFRDYNNLYEGDYTFEVRALDELGRTGPITGFAFTILPPWYRTPYAKLGYIAFALCLFVIVAQLRTRHLRIRNLELEAIVNQRTNELERSNQQLREANSIKQNFLASMSHEIRNPLNGILGIAQLLKQEPTTSKTTRVSHLNACATHLHQLLGQVLDFSSIESGKLEARPAPFDPNQLLREVVDMHQGLAEKKGLSLKLSVQEAACLWIGDSVLLRQTLINLVSNAIKYTPSGEVRIRMAFEKQNETLRATFTVEDTGPGIPEGQHEYIFKDFTRLGRAAESEAPGTGLGLAIAKQMTNRMHGILRVDSDYSHGARFVLELPFDTGGTILKKEDLGTPDNSRPLNGKRVLLADDMDFNRYICRELLEKLGAHVTEAEDGQLALEALHRENFEIAILDINMPGLDGRQVVRQFLERHVGQSPLFVALTAHVTQKMEQSALEAGFQHFIEKPLNPDQIRQIARAQPLRDRKANASDLLSYLAGDNAKSESRLRMRYLRSMREQAHALCLYLERHDIDSAGAVLHKLRGLANMQPNGEIMRAIETLSRTLARSGNPESASEQARRLVELIREE